MQPQQDPRARRTIEPTEARQASPRKGSFRVLLASMALAIAVGVVSLGITTRRRHDREETRWIRPGEPDERT